MSFPIQRPLSSAADAISPCSYGPLASILDDVLLHCQNYSTISAAHSLLRCINSRPSASGLPDSSTQLEQTLHEAGFSGLWKSCSLDSSHEYSRQYYNLTERLIEVCRAFITLLTYNLLILYSL